ncbi:FG-GAP repeat domain-containing protein [Actinoplanes sp. GCM10030250]|uniref:FG-GAP repeat domain-containing protein n=1 Tax=Actinoplanes sp. GCM10030250 TaxID=3273376 RepID=UPI003623B12C
MRIRLTRRLKLAAGLLLPLMVLAGGTATPAAAAPTASVALAAVGTTPVPCANNGSDLTLNRGQVMTRARSWLNVEVPYNQGRCYQNQYGDYRTDCSGFAAMAWGLGGAGNWFTTGDAPNRTHQISRNELKPGDALWRHPANFDDQHMALFVRWADAARTSPVVYEQTVVDNTNRDTIESTWPSGYANTYTPIRYDNIVDGGGDGTGSSTPDINGDGRADTVAVYDDGRAMWYPNNGTTRGENKFLSARPIFNAPAFRLMGTGDIDADGRADIVSVYDDGRAMWYPSNGGGFDQASFLSARFIFNAPGFRLMSVADVDSNGGADIVAVLDSGAAVWYPNNGTTRGETKFLSARPIFNAPGLRLLSMGDMDADGQPDIVGVTTSGETFWYPNNGGSFASISFLSGRKIFDAPAFRLMSTGDIDADGRADILAVYNTGELRWYPNNGTTRAGANFLSPRHIDNAPAFRLMSN